ncbi:MAG TPA: chemotaxis response regulator protein-glutamate methylesterase [Sedimenticola sp.]|nr:chemotaxis response regulator protein-glutamate methylesterase [Sedimenticola sp.]
MNAKIRVLVVDDSAFFRRRVIAMLGWAGDIEVVGEAADGLGALRQARRLRPDVITMDVEMPVMDGISALKRIMAEIPTPVLMLSALTREGAAATLDALDAGALDFLCKESVKLAADQDAGILAERVRALGRGMKRRPPPASGPAAEPGAPARPATPDHCELVVIGASTGGPVALQRILTSLPRDFPLPLLLVVHMPANFTPAFAERLDRQAHIRIREAVDGDRLQPGLALLAPGGKQMTLRRRGSGSVVCISEPEPGQTYRPSVDVTFESAARRYPDGVLAIVLTGMGADGMEGARMLKSGGSAVWTQNEASCVVFGMPQAVEKAGLSDRVLPLDQIGAALSKVV